MYLSPEDGLVALPHGPGTDWARTALDLSAFEENHEGIHVLALNTPATAQNSIDTLYRNAQHFGITVDITRRPFIGDAARRIAQALDGTWAVEIGNLQLPESDARQRLRWAWSAPDGSLSYTVGAYGAQMSAAAFLAHEDGRELMVAERPWDKQLLVGALAPHIDFPSLGIQPPASIVAPTEQTAVKKITRTLLPSYDRALADAHLLMLDATLAQVREARDSAEHADLMPLASALRQHAPYLIRHMRSTLPGPRAAQSAAVLDRAEETFTLAPPPEDQAASELLDQWLEHGTRLTEMTRSLDHGLIDRPAPAPAAQPGLPQPPSGPASPSPNTPSLSRHHR
ncbi:hypothetical protein ABZW26_04450 [Streptomyces sp. NPDC004623]|uniref:hypothetical protein n=1 Tax=Streptomyces sp. NPDC004623 TaxID=3156653 RepID=UPI0033B8DE21